MIESGFMSMVYKNIFAFFGFMGIVFLQKIICW